MIEIRKTKKYGRGLYAKRNIKKGEVVERSPALVIHKRGAGYDATELNVYAFAWKRQGMAIALGLGSLFNHSKRCNVTYNPVFHEDAIIFVATRNIKRGNQLFIDYGYDPKYGVERTERNLYDILKKKFDPESIEKSKDSLSKIPTVSMAYDRIDLKPSKLRMNLLQKVRHWLKYRRWIK